MCEVWQSNHTLMPLHIYTSYSSNHIYWEEYVHKEIMYVEQDKPYTNEMGSKKSQIQTNHTRNF